MSSVFAVVAPAQFTPFTTIDAPDTAIVALSPAPPNVMVTVPAAKPHVTTAVRRLLDADWAVNAGERYRIASGPAIRITITTLAAAEVAPLAAAVAASLVPARRTHSP